MLRPLRLSLDRAFRIAYMVGVFICIFCPIILQLTLNEMINPIPDLSIAIVHSIGYSFTGLILICILAINLRWKRIRSDFSSTTKDQQGIILLRETVLYSIVFGLSSFFGVTYYLLGGTPVKLFARNFITLTPIMFFLFVPRLHAWRKAADNSQQ